MKTKLVYVLTCGEEGTYIEQALISVYSARYHNPNAHIVLIVDDKTNELLVGKRAEVLEYVTEKVRVEVPDEFNLMQASRWLKTSVRNIIDGDFLFIDCDTVITQSLEEIDLFECEIGAVLDSNRLVSEYLVQDKEEIYKKASLCEWDLTNIEHYRNSGVMYVKDTDFTRKFYTLWHQNYLHTRKFNVHIDQISLEKTSQEIEIIEDIDNIWNAIMYTRPKFIKDAKIIHFLSHNNNSFLFSKRVLKYLKDNGLTSFIKYYIEHPIESFVPYQKKCFKGKNIFNVIRYTAKGSKQYATYIDAHFTDLRIPLRIGGMVKTLMKRKMYFLSSFVWMFWIRLTGKYNPLEKYYK